MPRRGGALPVSDAAALGCADAFARGVPHDRLDRLRSRTPVVWQDAGAAERPGAWAVLRYADVHHALTRPQLFLPEDDGVLHGPRTDRPGLEHTGFERTGLEHTSLEHTGLEHSGVEHPSGAGRPPERGDPDAIPDDEPSRAPIDMDPPMAAMLDRIPSGETVDFVRQVAHELPETLRNTLAGGLHALLRHPDQYARLRAERRDERLIDSTVEEMLRWWTPVLQVRRRVRRATRVGGVPLLPGERVALWLVSANHDAEVFREPGRFVPERFLAERSAQGGRPHLCFGTGRRACLGARLARAHLRAFLVALLERPALAQTGGEPVMSRSSARHGFERLPVRWNG
ncbi:cytochrome P450 [Actinomadura verrucosospora]|uniref:Cytochrome P450 n=1 Tax=Actinomadura verrucosospora TaxID=46165 RepID=A0A7D3ZNZ5_ACTVE|nr:cytochrome P450 [Actinomadura verrucosospora]QKG25281.1 cytochrome P450 [Actinomadura verrucosospora]